MIITDLLSGAIAGGIAKACIAPLDRTKIHFQINDFKYSLKEAVKYIQETHRRNGITALWRGNSATMVRILPYAALKYCGHEQFKVILRVDTNERKREHKARSFLAGSLAGLVSTVLVYPLDLARARMAVTNCEKIKLIDVFKNLVKNDGYMALYRGCLPSVIGIVPYAGVTFFTYETAKRLHYEQTKKEKPNSLQRMAFGALSGALGQFASYPFDVVRRRMQTSETKLGMIETATKIVKSPHPIRGMFRGLSLNWIKGPIAAGVSFTTFDLLKNFLGQ